MVNVLDTFDMNCNSESSDESSTDEDESCIAGIILKGAFPN